MIKSNKGSGSRSKFSLWNQIGKGLINKKRIRKEDATGEENTPGECASKVWTNTNCERVASKAKRSNLTK